MSECVCREKYEFFLQLCQSFLMFAACGAVIGILTCTGFWRLPGSFGRCVIVIWNSMLDGRDETRERHASAQDEHTAATIVSLHSKKMS